MSRRFFYDCEFIESPCTIDLISIGVIDDADNEFYAVSSEFDETRASPWVRENVLPHLGAVRLPRDEIARRLLLFLRPSKADPVELWGYYSAYDHVVLCWLFGPMVTLPAGMPGHTKDIKQLADEWGNPRLPKNAGLAHHALSDARWNRDAWRFLQRMLVPKLLMPVSP